MKDISHIILQPIHVPLFSLQLPPMMFSVMIYIYTSLLLLIQFLHRHLLLLYLNHLFLFQTTLLQPTILLYIPQIQCLILLPLYLPLHHKSLFLLILLLLILTLILTITSQPPPPPQQSTKVHESPAYLDQYYCNTTVSTLLHISATLYLLILTLVLTKLFFQFLHFNSKNLPHTKKLLLNQNGSLL